MAVWEHQAKEQGNLTCYTFFSLLSPFFPSSLYLYTEVKAASYLGKSFFFQTCVANFVFNQAVYTFSPSYRSGSTDPDGFWFAIFLPFSISSGHQ